MKSKELLLPLPQARIRAWLYCPDDGHQGLRSVVLFCHGIPGGTPVPGDRGYLDMVEELVRHGYCCVTFNFRGCGFSEGNIDMRGWFDDLEAVAESIYEAPGIDPEFIHCIAFSAGGSVASEYASRKKLFRSLMLMATPNDFKEILPDDPLLLRQHFRNIGIIRDDGFPSDIQYWYKGFLDMKASRSIGFISPCPVMIVHGDRDETVPPAHAQEIFASACVPKKLLMLEGATHQLRKDPRTMQIINDWLKENTQKP